MRVLATYNLKGGVGKTTCSVNLAFLASLEGWRTLLWDLDPQAAATFCFRIKPDIKGVDEKLIREEPLLDSFIRGTDFTDLDLLPADFSYRRIDLALSRTKNPTEQLARLLKFLEGDYDYIFLDCPPSISLVSESVFFAADALLVPLIPTPLSMRALEQLIAYLAALDAEPPAILPFFCMVDQRRSLHRETCQACNDGPSGFLTTQIPYSSLVEHMGIRRLPLASYAPASPAARAYSGLWREISERLVSLACFP